MTSGNPRQFVRVLELVYRAALAAVDPVQTVRDSLSLDGEVLRAGDRTYRLRDFRKVFLAGAGKAAVPMAAAVEQILGEHLSRGLVVVKYGHGGVLDKTRVLEAGHPEPDENGVAAASSYYGGGVAGEAERSPKCPIIMHFGELDAHIPMSDVDKVKAAQPDVPVYVYAADHGFNCDHRGSYDAPSADLARQRTLAFFAEHLG